MPPAKGAKYKKRVTTPAMLEAARNRRRMNEPGARHPNMFVSRPEVIEKMVAGKNAKRERQARAERAVAQAGRRAKAEHDRHPAVVLYRREKKRAGDAIAAILAEAKAHLQREDELNKIARRGGRPKKVVNG